MLNGALLTLDNSSKDFLKANYGISTTNLNCFSKRLEKTSVTNLKIKRIKYNILKNTLKSKIPQKTSLKEWSNGYIIINMVINNYKGYRHLRGLPVHGQRTWSNAWSAFRTNLFLRNFKLDLAKKYYGNINYSDIKLAFLAEQTNLFWKIHWTRLWKKAFSLRQNKSSKKKNRMLKPELALMAKNIIFFPSTEKELTKKQKTNYEKAIFSVGYRVGFTKILLKDLIQRFLAKTNTSSSSSVSLLTTAGKKKKQKKKPVDKKLKQLKHKIKKQKKKSIWD